MFYKYKSFRTHLNFLFLTENELKFDQMRHFLKAIVMLKMKKKRNMGKF